MSQRNISGLPMPEPAYRVDRATDRSDGQARFESISAARGEDTRRASGLLRAISRHSAVIDEGRARHLAAQLQRSGETGENPETPASSLYMRKQRLRVIGALWRIIVEGR